MRTHSQHKPDLGWASGSSLTFIREFWLWPVVLVAGAIVFLAAPGPYGHTAHEVLHGLCAQTPSHTISIGGQPLPFDSRMTGIYGGVLITLGVLIAKNAVFRYGALSKGSMAILVMLVAGMAVDGFNSLFHDLMIWHPYAPSNAMRLVTGYGTGCALAIGLSWLLGSSTWKMSTAQPTVGGWRDFVGPMAGLLAFGAALLVRPDWSRLPITVLLVVSAWITIALLMLVIVLLTARLDERVRRVEQLHVPGAIAAVLAIAAMLLLATFRFWVERTFGISNSMM